MRKFHHLYNYIIDLLGEPIKIELEKFGSFDLGTIQWQNDAVRLTLIGIEQFSCKYSLSIGLIQNINNEWLNEIITNNPTINTKLHS